RRDPIPGRRAYRQGRPELSLRLGRPACHAVLTALTTPDLKRPALRRPFLRSKRMRGGGLFLMAKIKPGSRGTSFPGGIYDRAVAVDHEHACFGIGPDFFRADRAVLCPDRAEI